MTPLSRTILLVEDNKDDVFLIQRSFKKAGIVNPLYVAKDGKDAIDYLSGEGTYADRARYPLPFMAFIDLKIPLVDGFEVLKWVRGQRSLDSLVIIVLTSSNQDRDYQQAYGLGARSYVVKPPAPEHLLQLMTSLNSFWNRTSGVSPVMMEKSPAQR
jgi:CheY-like chemotaxis protein